MKTRPLALALLVALAPATFQLPVYAQAEDATTAMARARFKEGVEFYDKGEYEQSRASFLQAYALKKHPAVLLNLAWSCVKSGHALEAERYFKQFLAEGKDITDKQRADANDGLAQAHNKLGRIEISATAGTEINVDGDKIGTAPISDPVWVEAGAHTIKFKGPDGTTDTQSVTVLGGERQAAHFGKAGGSAVAMVTPPPSNTNPEPTPPPEAKPETKSETKAETKTEPPAEPPEPPKEKSSGGSSSNPLSPPAALWPEYLLGVVALGGFIGAGVLAGSKSNAQNQANTTAQDIVSNGGGASTCTAAGIAAAPKFKAACTAYQSDINDVNSDATVANVLIGVSIAAIATGVIYWFVADKKTTSSMATAPVLTPVVGQGQGGLSLSLKF
jgi:hypothetical protein